MSGKEARDTFFHEKALSLTEGHQFLTGGVSQIPESHEPLLNFVFFCRIRGWMMRSSTNIP